MGFKEQVRALRCFDFVGGLVGEAGLGVGAGVGVRPAIKGAGLWPDHVIGDELVAKAITLLHDSPQLAGVGMNGQPACVAHARDIGLLA